MFIFSYRLVLHWLKTATTLWQRQLFYVLYPFLFCLTRTRFCWLVFLVPFGWFNIFFVLKKLNLKIYGSLICCYSHLSRYCAKIGQETWLHDKREAAEGKMEMLHSTASNCHNALDKIYDLRNCQYWGITVLLAKKINKRNQTKKTKVILNSFWHLPNSQNSFCLKKSEVKSVYNKEKFKVEENKFW